jgi:hypothetical protein
VLPVQDSVATGMGTDIELLKTRSIIAPLSEIVCNDALVDKIISIIETAAVVCQEMA